MGMLSRWIAALACLLGGLPPQDRTGPNVLIICADDHAAYVMGAAGDAKVRTPNLDRLASRGLRFDRAFANMPLCTPSRHSFITGRYPRTIGVTCLGTPFPDRETTLAELLKSAGYDTCAIGKMQFNTERSHGFDRLVYSAEYQDHVRRKGRQPLPKDLDVLPPWKAFTDPAVWLNSRYRPFGAADADMVGTFFAREAAGYLESRVGERPFFLMVSFNEPHSPYRFPIEYRDRHRPASFAVPKPGPEDDEGLPAAFRGLSEQDKQGILASYYTSVEFMDKNVGLVLDALERSGRAKDTLVIYLSDHGLLLGQHGWFEKHALFDPAVRAPLIVRHPGRVGEGRASGALVELVDLVPTVLEFAGLDVPANVQGRSLVGLLEGRTAAHRSRVFVEYALNEEAMVRTERWKLIYSLGKTERRDGFATGRPPGGRRVRLYDLAEDPGETVDLAARPEQAERVRELTSALAEHLKKTARRPEELPADGDVHRLMEACLPSRDWAAPAGK
jgi:choline-sulfatase